MLAAGDAASERLHLTSRGREGEVMQALRLQAPACWGLHPVSLPARWFHALERGGFRPVTLGGPLWDFYDLPLNSRECNGEWPVLVQQGSVVWIRRPDPGRKGTVAC